MTHKMMFKHRWLFAPLILIAIAGFSLITMLLWNAVIPDIFHLPAINFDQAICLLILSRLLFGGHFRPNHSRQAFDLRRKMASLSPEEREIFIKKLQDRRTMWWDHCDMRQEDEAKKPV